MIYYGDFESAENVFENFEVPAEERKGVHFLYASYENEGYDGSANAVFFKEGKFYEVSGSHCSCYGLEDQWDPEEIDIALLRGMDKRKVSAYGSNYHQVLANIDAVVDQDTSGFTDDQFAVVLRLVLG